MGLLLLRARCWEDGGWSEPRTVRAEEGLLGPPGEVRSDDAEVDLGGRFLLPALVNAYDVLDLSTLPPLGSPPHASVYEWTKAAEADVERLGPALAVDGAPRALVEPLGRRLAAILRVTPRRDGRRGSRQSGYNPATTRGCCRS